MFTLTSHRQLYHRLTPSIPARQRLIGGFFNSDQLLKNVQPELTTLLILLRNQFGNIPQFLNYYIQATYFDGVQRKYRCNRGYFPRQNTAQAMYICQSLLNNEDFNVYSFIRQRISAFAGPAGTG